MTERPTCATCRWWGGPRNADPDAIWIAGDCAIKGIPTAQAEGCPEHQPRETESDIPSQR